MEKVRLTQYSHGAGCGCKISPDTLSKVLPEAIQGVVDANILVGNDSRDDAAAYDLGDGTAIISTTDFFMPIVDDPFTFGRIAASNAISDVYAMGGTPLLAIAILGWPLDKLAPEIASVVMDGAKESCRQAGINIAGGHSIDSPEPIFGLAVTGRVKISELKKNDTAKDGDLLYLTKPLGVGILSTAQKRSLLKPEHAEIAPNSMMMLNKVGEDLAKIEGVSAITDVTGFGLLGHLMEMCEGSEVSAEVNYKEVPQIDCLQEYIAQKSMPGATRTNWQSVSEKVYLAKEEWKYVLCDPQTSGGLLVSVSKKDAEKVEELLRTRGLCAKPLGKLVSTGEKRIRVS